MFRTKGHHLVTLMTHYLWLHFTTNFIVPTSWQQCRFTIYEDIIVHNLRELEEGS